MNSEKSHEKSQGLILKIKIPKKSQSPKKIPRSWDKIPRLATLGCASLEKKT